MADGGTASVLKRKTNQARAGAAGDFRGPIAPGKALSDAFRRAVEEELQLSVIVGEPRERYATPAEIVESLPDQSFLGILIGPEDGAGLFCLDPAALSSVIEVRTMGRVSARPPVARRPTATDAAMVADLIDRILSEFETPLLTTEDARWAAGWKYQLFLPDPRPLAVVLEESTHRVLETEILFGAAAKPGRVTIALPATGRAFPREPEPPPAESAEAAAAEHWRRALGEAVETAEAALDAVLGRVRLPLEALAGLAPGDRIALPIAALGTVLLVAPGGKTVADGRLGQTGGARAVRIGDLSHEPALQSAEGIVIPGGTLRGSMTARSVDLDGAPDAFHPAQGRAGIGGGPAGSESGDASLNPVAAQDETTPHFDTALLDDPGADGPAPAERGNLSDRPDEPDQAS